MCIRDRDYDVLTPDDMVVMDLEGNKIEGKYKPSSDTATHLELYKKMCIRDRVRLVDEYDADDEASMSDNNSSAFNFRFISHTTKISKHGMGICLLYTSIGKKVWICFA